MVGHFLYEDRLHAGRVIADELVNYSLDDPLILALPRGGLPVALQIAREFKKTFDVLVVRKIGAPFNREFGIGAITEDLEPLMNPQALMSGEDWDEEIRSIVEEEKMEVQRRIKLYRQEKELPDFKNRTVILVDDGLATGVTAAAGGRFLKKKGANKVLLAVPVGPQHISDIVLKNIDEVVCPYRPSGFSAVGNWYKNFRQISDEEVIKILNQYHPINNQETGIIHAP